MYPASPCRLKGLFLGVLLAAPLGAAASNVLTMHEAERIALGDDPATLRYTELAAARQQAAIAARQLPDPMLITELMDVPADSLRLDDDAMTQLRLGIRQSFPRGQSRQLGSAREQALAQADSARAENAERAVVRAVRRAYLELYYQRAALEVLEQSRLLFEDLNEITEREFGAGRATQQDMLRAELELERLEDRLLDARSREAVALAQLAQWVGREQVSRPLSPGFPALPESGGSLQAHPLLTAASSGVEAGRRGVELSRQGYRPQWSVELTYGRPTASGSGMDQPDRLSAMVMVDLPLFTRQRQDREVAASMHRRDAAELDWRERQRELERQQGEAEARWQQLLLREQRFEDRLLPQATANAEAAEQAYRARTTDFTGFVRARLIELETRLDALRVATDRRLQQAELLYLLGERAS